MTEIKMSLKTVEQVDGAAVWKSTPLSKSKKPPSLQRNKRVVNTRKKKMARNQALV